MSDLNVARLVPHNEQDALLAAACPLPDMVAGVGHVFHRGEYWLLIYESCGHDQYFRRTADGLYDLADVEAEIRRRYSTPRPFAGGPTDGGRGGGSARGPAATPAAQPPAGAPAAGRRARRPASSSAWISALNSSARGWLMPASQSCTVRRPAPTRPTSSSWVSPVRPR